MTAAFASSRSPARKPAAASRSAARSCELGESGCRARRGTARPARGGSRGSRPARRGPAPRSSSHVGEALVQLGARRLRERVVGGVADQQVPEAEGVVAGQRRRRSGGRAPCGRARAAATGRRDRPARAPRPRPGGRPAPRPRRARAPRARTPAAGRAAPRAAPGSSSGTVTSLGRLLDHREHLLDEERVPLGGGADPLAERRDRAPGRRAARRSARRSRRPRAARAARRSRSACPPPQPGRSSSSSGRARQSSEDRRVAGPVADVLDQVEERRLAPLDVVEHDHERPLRGRRLEQLAHRDRDLVRRRLPLAEQRGDRRVRRRASPPSSCFTAATTGQYVIPSP